MSWGFPLLALAMLAGAGLLIGRPLWRPLPGLQGAASPPPRRHAAVMLSAGLALGVGAIYVGVGKPEAWLDPVSATPTPQAQEAPGDPPAAGIGPAQIEAMVARLAQRLTVQPEDADGWRMLARSYESLRRFDEAVLAYQRLIALQKPDADLLVDYAVTLGMSKGQTLAGEPEAILMEVLQQAPGHPQALALSGSAAFERRDYASAIQRWQALLVQTPPDSADMRAAVQANIDKARDLSVKR